MRRIVVLALVLAATLGPAATARAGAPTDQLREYTDRVLKILEDPSLQPADRRAAVRRVADEAFDVTETARRALGQHWSQRTPAEQEQFVQAFADLLEQTYISRIDEYGGERIRYVGEQVDGDHAVVRARIMTRQGTEVPVESRLLRRGDRWLIYDVIIENVSLIANYRSQFDRIIRTASFDELLRRVRARNDALRAAPPRRPTDAGRK
jgi:phospholipid transport system substrate-binding protein